MDSRIIHRLAFFSKADLIYHFSFRTKTSVNWDIRRESLDILLCPLTFDTLQDFRSEAVGENGTKLGIQFVTERSFAHL